MRPFKPESRAVFAVTRRGRTSSHECPTCPDQSSGEKSIARTPRIMVPVTFFFHASSETTGETNYAVSLRQHEAGGASGAQDEAGTNTMVAGVQVLVFAR